MSEDEIIHVMSAGASINKTIPVAVNEISRALTWVEVTAQVKQRGSR